MTTAQRSLAGRFLVVVLSSCALSACFVTDTEVVTANDAVRLAGRRVVQDDRMAQRKTVFTWNEAQKGYLDPEDGALVRFARLQGETYLTQVELTSRKDATLPADRKVYMLLVAKVTASQLRLESANCRADSSDREWFARGFGVEIDTRREFLMGKRDGIIGYLAAMLACETSPLDFVLIPEALSLGGAELAGQGVRYDRARLATFFSAACDRGEVESCYKLGQTLQKGDGVQTDPARAAQLFRQVCGAGDARACLDLGLLYESGQGVDRNPDRARDLFKQACEGGEMFACETLKRRP